MIDKTDNSLKTALSVRPGLTKYIVCFPYNLTGRTNRPGKRNGKSVSETEKFEDWIAKSEGGVVKIEVWPASKLLSLLLEKDTSGGIRYYFFSSTVLSKVWFEKHLRSASKHAGPRYSGALHVDTRIDQWFSAFAGDQDWRGRLNSWIEKRTLAIQKVARHLGPLESPQEILLQFETAINACQRLISEAQSISIESSESWLSSFSEFQRVALAAVNELFESLKTIQDKRFSIVSDLLIQIRTFHYFLKLEADGLVFQKSILITGAGGSGKTHGLCDAANKRFKKGGYTCLVFGDQFQNQPHFWTRLAEVLDMPGLGKDQLLDALQAAALDSNQNLFIFVDALNETRPRNYWHNSIRSIELEFRSRPNLKLCVSCRTSFVSVCLEQDHPFPILEHEGFSGFQFEAWDAFFRYYDLDPPFLPILPFELANPLFLKLLCQTAQSQGLKQIPADFLGFSAVLKSFLLEKEKLYANHWHACGKWSAY